MAQVSVFLCWINSLIFVLSGMQDFETIKTSVSVIQKHHSNFSILHCVSAYPTPIEDINLSIMNLYRETFPGVTVGYSGHEEGIIVPIAAVACGAKV
jgi:sialic acid synthase SpsE